MMNLSREISERNLGNEIQGRENLGLQIGETLKRTKGERKGEIKCGRVT